MAKRTCSVDGCGNPHEARGWCAVHYGRRRRHGDPAHFERVVTLAPPEERFWAKVDKRGPDDCWKWTASVFEARNGYGKFQAGQGRGTTDVRYAHRFAYEVSVGPIPPGLHVLHSCDNPPCVNPAHLRVGTRADNMRDMHDRGRDGWATGKRKRRHI